MRNVLVALVTVLVLAAIAVLNPTTPTPTPTPATWLSGVRGTGATDGSYGAWRGRPVDIVGAFNDNYESQAAQWSLRPGYELGSWRGNVDNAIGAIYKERGETWAAAAAGAYDSRWSAALTKVNELTAANTGTVYLRFAHEFNGDWYGWSVRQSETTDFIAAWKRFRALQLGLAPRARLVFCPSSDTSESLGLDWRAAFPGPGQVDVLGLDYYNQWPFIATQAEFDSTALLHDGTGAPRGLERFRQFALAQGLPLALSEWSSNAQFGDSSPFVQGLNDWLKRNAGQGPGKILYEIQFNSTGYENKYRFYPETIQPDAVARYRALW